MEITGFRPFLKALQRVHSRFGGCKR